MSNSDDQGFHQSSIEMFTIKTRNFAETKTNKSRSKSVYLFKSALSLHHQLPLFEYPKQLDIFICSTSSILTPKRGEQDPIILVQAGSEPPILLSEFFPRKLNCVYNRFQQNLIIKRDTTILIRNIGSRVRNEQLTTFHDIASQPPSNQPLEFTSNFEGGNLHCAFRSRRNGAYYLLLQNDINTHGYNIWFHFKIRANQGGNYQFIIANLAKQVKFQSQAAIITYNSRKHQYERSTGFRCSQTRFRHCQNFKKFWSLHFEYRFEPNEEVYFSLLPPYTYSKMSRLLRQVTQGLHLNQNVYAEIAGKSQLGNHIPCLKIGSKDKESKKSVLITARQHPCQTVGSFVCEEMIKILTSYSQFSLQLLKHFDFHILPMLNPDGVIHGNSRTNLVGYDINRSWDMNSPIKTAETSQVWTYLTKMMEDNNRISWSFDLHGHSKELGYFAYFCEQNESTILMDNFLASKDFYDQQKSGFFLSKGKRQSLRGQLYLELNVQNAATIQISYFGFRDKNGSFLQFTQHHFHSIAFNLLQSLLSTEKVSHNLQSKQKILHQIQKVRSSNKQKNIYAKQNVEIQSNSDPEQDYLLKSQRNEELDDISRKKSVKFRSKTQYSNRSKYSSSCKKQIMSSFMKSNHFASLKVNTSNENQKSLPFNAGRRALSPSNLKRYVEHPRLIRSKQGKACYQSKISGGDSQEQQFQYLKKTLVQKRQLKPENQKHKDKDKTYVGGFRACYQVIGLKTITYPTAASAGIQFQNNLKSKKQTIKQFRNRDLRSHQPWQRKFSQTHT